MWKNEFKFISCVEGRSSKTGNPFYNINLLADNGVIYNHNMTAEAFGMAVKLPPMTSVLVEADYRVFKDNNSMNVVRVTKL